MPTEEKALSRALEMFSPHSVFQTIWNIIGTDGLLDKGSVLYAMERLNMDNLQDIWAGTSIFDDNAAGLPDVPAGAKTDNSKISLITLLSGFRRTIFHTSDGLIGVGPPGTAVDDQVCVVHGCPLPILLRPTTVGDQWQHVGTCYVLGLPDGEEDTEFWSEERETSEFQLV